MAYLSYIRLSALVLLLTFVTMTTWAQSTAYVSTYDELSAAVSNASVNNIVVTANIDVPCGTSGNAGNADLTGASTAQLIINRTLTLQSQAGSKFIIKRIAANGANASTLKSMIAIRGNGHGNNGNDNLTENNVEVSFTNIIIDGGANWGASNVNERRNSAADAYGNAGRSMIDVYLGGVLNLEDGVELRNGYTTKSDNSLLNDASTSQCFGGAVRVDYHNNTGGGTVNIKAGASIHDCTARGGYGGALGAYNYARLNLYGGTISNCSATNGGAIACTYRSATGYGSDSAGTIRMYGGTISNCHASHGGAFLMHGTNVDDYFLGGTITGCSATDGGVMYVGEKKSSPNVHLVAHSSGRLTISSCSNTHATSAESTGGYDYIYLNKGTISETPVYQVTFIHNNTEFAVLHVLQGDSLGEAFPAAPVNAGLRFLGWYNGNTQVTSSTAITDNITLTAKWDFYGSGTDADPYQIPSANAWNLLADRVSDGNSYSGKYFRQTGDFTITRMMGTAIHADGGNQEEEFKTFNGTYDGYGHTITANLNVTGERYAGPFHCIADGATIKNLIVTGSVTVSGGSKVEATRHPAGLVGTTRSGSCVIENCRVSANVSGADYMGGLLGHSWHANITISGCVYSGTLTANDTNYTGGLIGWGGDDGGKTIVLTNNLFSGSYSGSGKFHPVGVLCSLDNYRTVTNAYYTAGLVNMANNDGNSLVKGLSDQGTFATPSSDKPANLGTPIAVYSVSGITVYTNGLCQAGQYICSSPEYDYSLSVASAIILGESKYVTTFYHGTLDYELPAGALAYTAGKDGDKVVFYRIGPDSNIIPQNTAVIIVADASAVSEGKVPLTKITSAGVTPGINILTGSDTDVTELTGNEYVLGIAGGVIGFYPFTGSAIPAGKAYYVVN